MEIQEMDTVENSSYVSPFLDSSALALSPIQSPSSTSVVTNSTSTSGQPSPSNSFISGSSSPTPTNNRKVERNDPLWNKFVEIETSTKVTLGQLDRFANTFEELLDSHSFLEESLNKLYLRSNLIEESRLGPVVKRLNESGPQEKRLFGRTAETNQIIQNLLDCVAAAKNDYDVIFDLFKERFLVRDGIEKRFSKIKKKYGKTLRRRKDPTLNTFGSLTNEYEKYRAILKDFNNELAEDLNILYEQRQDPLDIAFLALLKLKQHISSNYFNIEMPSFFGDLIENSRQIIVSSPSSTSLTSPSAPKIVLPNFITQDLDMNQFLSDKMCLQFFQAYLISEHSEENLHFFLEIQKFEESSEENLRPKAEAMYNEFIKGGAAHEINLSHTTKEKLKEIIETNNKSVITKDVFQRARKEILALMSSDSFDRFRKSELYGRLQRRLTKRNYYIYDKPALDYDLQNTIRKRSLSGADAIKSYLSTAEAKYQNHHPELYQQIVAENGITPVAPASEVMDRGVSQPHPRIAAATLGAHMHTQMPTPLGDKGLTRRLEYSQARSRSMGHYISPKKAAAMGMTSPTSPPNGHSSGLHGLKESIARKLSVITKSPPTSLPKMSDSDSDSAPTSPKSKRKEKDSKELKVTYSPQVSEDVTSSSRVKIPNSSEDMVPLAAQSISDFGYSPPVTSDEKEFAAEANKDASINSSNINYSQTDTTDSKASGRSYEFSENNLRGNSMPKPKKGIFSIGKWYGKKLNKSLSHESIPAADLNNNNNNDDDAASDKSESLTRSKSWTDMPSSPTTEEKKNKKSRFDFFKTLRRKKKTNNTPSAMAIANQQEKSEDQSSAASPNSTFMSDSVVSSDSENSRKVVSTPASPVSSKKKKKEKKKKNDANLMSQSLDLDKASKGEDKDSDRSVKFAELNVSSKKNKKESDGIDKKQQRRREFLEAELRFIEATKKRTEAREERRRKRQEELREAEEAAKLSEERRQAREARRKRLEDETQKDLEKARKREEERRKIMSELDSM